MNRDEFLNILNELESVYDSDGFRRVLIQNAALANTAILVGKVRIVDYKLESITSRWNEENGQKYVNMIQALIDIGADVNHSDFLQSSIGPIYRASEKSVRLVRVFLDNGANLNHDLFGKPACWPLINAVCSGKLEIVQYLVEQGAVINFVNIHGMSPLDYAHQMPEIREYLTAQGAKSGKDLPRDHLPTRNTSDATEQRFESAYDVLRYSAQDGCEEFPLREIVPGDPPLTLYKGLNFEGGYTAIFTDGMSTREMNVPPGETKGIRRSELCVLLPPDWPLTEEAMQEERFRFPIDWLRQLARWPFQSGSYYRTANIVANGEPPEPLGPGTEMTCWLVHQLDGSVWKFLLKDGSEVNVLIVLPLFTSERDFERSHGIDALIEKLDYRKEMFNIKRDPVV